MKEQTTVISLLKENILCLNAIDELAWSIIWNKEKLNLAKPIDIALKGGMISDRLSWVFISGYQAALKHVFGDIKPIGWTALVASEDRKNTETRPGTRTKRENGIITLSGFKSWVAQSRFVDHLIVTAKEGDDENKKVSAFLVSSKNNGVELSHRESPSFLGDMSQGFAKFDEVDVTSARQYSKMDIKRFTQSEPLFVMLAATAFMINHTTTLKNDLVRIAQDLVIYIEEPEDTSQTLVELDKAFQGLVKQFEEFTNCDEIPNWSNDRVLLSMYSKGIQKRSGSR